jgi:hypothetical protein
LTPHDANKHHQLGDAKQIPAAREWPMITLKLFSLSCCSPSTSCRPASGAKSIGAATINTGKLHPTYSPSYRSSMPRLGTSAGPLCRLQWPWPPRLRSKLGDDPSLFRAVTSSKRPLAHLRLLPEPRGINM